MGLVIMSMGSKPPKGELRQATALPADS